MFHEVNENAHKQGSSNNGKGKSQGKRSQSTIQLDEIEELSRRNQSKKYKGKFGLFGQVKKSKSHIELEISFFRVSRIFEKSFKNRKCHFFGLVEKSKFG